ncbi:MAG: chitinase, partial [Burkholderiales bacterium]|nr:chitinase [Burkholderiales bacterium]
MNLKQMLVLVYALAGSSALGFAANPASNKVTANSNKTAAVLPSCDPWLASKVYTAGNYVFNNKVWRAKWWSQSETPGNAAVWEVRAASECIAGSGGGDTGGTIPKGVPTLKQVQADELSKTSSPLFQNIKASIRTLDSAAVELVQAGRAANPTNVKRIEKILNVNDWQTLFPMRDASYSYVRFL